MQGFVFIDKPEGITSFSAVSVLRRLTGEKRCGHTGTLDPMATGVLVAAVGKSTRFIELIQSDDKEYEAGFELGKRTDTLDSTGEVTETAAVNCSKAEIEAALSCFEGEITQLPPMFSAVKKDGKRLYELAREGKEVERSERTVTVFSARLLGYDEEKKAGKLFVSCSGGTYIRTLIDDLGEKLGCFATMTALRRVRANGVSIERCFSLEKLRELKSEGKLDEAIVSTAEFLNFPSLTVTAAQAKRFSNGGFLNLDRLKILSTARLFSVFSPENAFIGVGEADFDEGALKPLKIIGE